MQEVEVINNYCAFFYEEVNKTDIRAGQVTLGNIQCIGAVTWREEDPSTWKILEGGTTFCLLCMQKFLQKWLPRGEGKEESLLALSS